MDLEQWMGPSCAVEGYVPLDCESRNGKFDDEIEGRNGLRVVGLTTKISLRICSCIYYLFFA